MPPAREPHPLKFWIGVILFFGVGVSIGLFTAFEMLERGRSVVTAILIGGCAGGFNAWLIFFVVARIVGLTQRPPR